MLQLSLNRTFAIVCLMLGLGIFSSCEKDDDSLSGVTQLLSFGPTGAKHGDTLRFIGTGLNKVTSIQFTGTNAVVEQSDFKQHSPGLILLIVPQAAEEGQVTLKTESGDITTKTKLNLNVKTNFQITSMTAQARPGENITLSGKYLNWVKRVTFARGKAVQTFVSKSMNSLVVTVPPDAETGPLIITYAGTDTANVETSTALTVTLPVITALAPNPVKHQTDLTITGTDIDLVKKVWFEGVSNAVETFVSQSATQLVLKVPAGASKGKVWLEAASGVKTSSANDLNVLLPAIATMSPSPVDPEANLTITGTNLDLVTAISFVGPSNPVTSFVSKSPTQIVVKVPVGVLKGKLVFKVLNSTLTVTSPADLLINGGLPPLPAFAYALYTDSPQNGFQDWSWATRDFNSTANVREGSKSIKATFEAYKGITLHNDNGLNLAPYTKLEFSMFGEAGTDGKTMNVVINGGWSNPVVVTIVQGEWKTYSLDISSLPNPNPLNEIIFQSTFDGVVHIDHVGLR